MHIILYKVTMSFDHIDSPLSFLFIFPHYHSFPQTTLLLPSCPPHACACVCARVRFIYLHQIWDLGMKESM